MFVGGEGGDRSLLISDSGEKIILRTLVHIIISVTF